ncbi:MAG: non-ribosomal peptide synthetase, partial [bacterium]|nr:non-ribosomal peptide synthetase [bacterium]
RTTFTMKAGEPVQTIEQRVPFKIERIETTKDRDEQQIAAQFVRPFDLIRAPQLRVGLIETTETTKTHEETPGRTPDAAETLHIQQTAHTRRILMIDMHHIITDAISMGIFIEELMEIYSGKKPAPLRLQYKDYSQWQNSAGWKEMNRRQEEWWLKQFEGEIPVLKLPADYARPALWSFEGKTAIFKLTKEETVQLQRRAEEYGSTLFMILQATVGILLTKLSGQENIVIGTPVMGRPHADLQTMIGIFINTLALKSNPTGEKKVNRYLEEITHTTLEALENQEYPFENLVDNIAGITRDTGRNPLFDVMFSYQEAEDRAIEIPGLTLKPYEYENSTA